MKTNTACFVTSRRLSIGDICCVVRRMLGAKIIERPCTDIQLEASCCATLQHTHTRPCTDIQLEASCCATLQQTHEANQLKTSSNAFATIC